jgi:hypothetical protein
MRIVYLSACCLFAIAGCVHADTIDISTRVTQLLESGDSLRFEISDSSLARYASQLDISPYPSSLNFIFASLPLDASGEFSALLESPDGSAIANFPNLLSWTSGSLATALYGGAVSLASGTISLSPTASQEIFAGSYADLVLTYSGPAVTIGLPGYTLAKDMWVSMSSGPLSVGSMIYDVSLTDPGPFNPSPTATTFTAAGVHAPEPPDSVLVFAGSGFCLLAAILRRWRSTGVRPADDQPETNSAQRFDSRPAV